MQSDALYTTIFYNSLGVSNKRYFQITFKLMKLKTHNNFWKYTICYIDTLSLFIKILKNQYFFLILECLTNNFIIYGYNPLVL